MEEKSYRRCTNLATTFIQLGKMTRSQDQEADSTCLTRSAKDPQGHSGENGNGAKLVGENVKISDAADFIDF